MKRNEFSDTYKNEKAYLQSKKENVFPSKDFKKWEIDQEKLLVPKLDLLNNKTLAMRYMFTKVLQMLMPGQSRHKESS